MARALALLLSPLVLAAPAAAAPATWTPAAWASAETLDLSTNRPDEGPHTFPVWLVVLDDQLYVRLGDRAADRVQKSASAPYIGVTVGGTRFDRVRCEPAPDKVEAVAEALGKKYWSDVIIRYFPHPLTCRHVPE